VQVLGDRMPSTLIATSETYIARRSNLLLGVQIILLFDMQKKMFERDMKF